MRLSSPLIGQSLLMLIFPLAAYLLFTAWCSPLVSQDVISHQKLVRLLCATHWQTGRKTSHQACSHQVSPYGADVVTDRCADLAAPCCLWLVRCCLHRNGVLGMSGGLGSMCAVSCGSWQPWGVGGSLQRCAKIVLSLTLTSESHKWAWWWSCRVHVHVGSPPILFHIVFVSLHKMRMNEWQT